MAPHSFEGNENMKINIKRFINRKKDASTISVPIEKELYGVKIRKLANGSYIKALNMVQNLPQLILEGCFPGQGIDKIMEFFENINTDRIITLAGKLLAVLPKQLLKFISELLDIPMEKLIGELSPNETLEIIKAFWEANDLTPFFENIKKTISNKKIINLMTSQNEISSLTANIGSRTGKSLPRNSVSGKKHS